MDAHELLATHSREIEWARELIDLSWTYRAARAVQVAHGAGIFERLAGGPATAAGVAAGRELEAAMVERLLIACAALDLVRREGGAWALTPKARATLLPGAPLYQGHTLAHAASVWSFWNDLPLVVRGQQRPAAPSPAPARQRSHRDFILAMHNMAMAGRAAELVARVDLAGKRTLLDVGGGPGTYAIAFCRRYPALQATVFDLPHTLEITREVLARFDAAGQVRAMEGNWDTDDFGGPYDALLMSSVLHGPGSRAEMKLAKATRAMNPGGVLILQDFLLNAQKTGPLKPALFNVMIGAFSIDELANLVAAAGFSQVRTQPLPEDLGTTLVTAVRESGGVFL